MKRIVNGVTYNTDTSTRLGMSRWDDDGNITETLYQTRGGAFFLHRETVSEVWNEEDRSKHLATVHTFKPQSPEDAHKWIMTGEVEIFRNPFDDPPEAAAEAEPGATIYIRVPASLKRAVDEAAKDDGISGNVWSMRCVERCLEEDDQLKNLFGNLVFGLDFLTRPESSYSSKERFNVIRELQAMIGREWRRFDPKQGKNAEYSETLRRHIVSFADEQIDEHWESAIKGRGSWATWGTKK
ncbi:hypothetical protein [Nitrobacter sp.]|uniref:hypothetical protein n=1 Tax=Nitrobacter sp. TaxID=29420 RepID=UPI003F64C25F